MKRLMILFGFYILALSVIPCCSGLCCNDAVTSSQAPASPRQEAPCSPLFACCASHGVVIPRNHIVLIRAEVISAKHPVPVTGKPPAVFVSNIWQPPRSAFPFLQCI
jgi:hypothetical protein